MKLRSMVFVLALAAACGSNGGQGGQAGMTGASGTTGGAGGEAAGAGGDAAGGAGGDAAGVTGSAGAAGADGSAGSGGASAGSGGASAGSGGASAGSGGAAGGATGAAGACVPVVQQHTEEGTRSHIACTPPPVYGTNPPSSGNHYPVWADYKTYATPVPWGHLMHSLEHGAVILVYNCPGGCPAEVARAQALIDALPPVDGQTAAGFVGPLAAGQVDPTCEAPTKRRLILAPDPQLDVRWAATAWTWTLKSSCFDEAPFAAFIKAHADQMVEDFCSEAHPTFCAVTP